MRPRFSFVKIESRLGVILGGFCLTGGYLRARVALNFYPPRMGKKILLWVLSVTALIIAFGSVFDELKTDDVSYEVLIVFVTIIFMTRLVFDDAYQGVSFRRTFFLYTINAIVSAVFFIAILFTLSATLPKLSALEREQNSDYLLFQQYQERLADLRGESTELQKKLDEEMRANAFEQEWSENQKQSDELMVSERERDLLQELAQTNREPLAGTAIMIKQEDSDFLRGRVVFAVEPKKNGIFFAQQRKDSGKWEIFLNQANDGLNCDGYEGSEIEIPKSMLEDCIKYERDGKIRATDGWKLTSGDPNQDCSAVEYSGEVEVDAWFEWRNSYVEKEWMLAVADNDRPKLLLGWPWKPYFTVSDISDKLRAKLMAASPEKPAKVTVKKMHYYCEGAPWLDIE